MISSTNINSGTYHITMENTHPSQLRHVRFTAGRFISQRASRKETQQERLLKEQVGPRFLDTRLETSAVHTCRGRFGVKCVGEEHVIHLKITIE